MTTVKVTWLKAGYCTHPEAIVTPGGDWKTLQFPALFALIEHPTQGAILFDTGYSDRFFAETQRFPARLYALVTPVFLKPEDSAIAQLQQQGIDSSSIRFIIISHFHADHIGGLRDFPNARFVCFRSAYNAVKQRRGLGALKAGFLSGLLPADFEQRAQFVEASATSLPELDHLFDGFDLFGDRSLIAVELPGHAIGQLGLFFVNQNQQAYFLVADACWLSRAYREMIEPSAIATLIFSDRRAYRTTLKKLHQLHQQRPEIRIVPTHCPEWQQYD